MEETYPVESYRGKASQKFRLGEYFQEYSRFLDEMYPAAADPDLSTKTSLKEKITTVMGISDNAFEELDHHCK